MRAYIYNWLTQNLEPGLGPLYQGSVLKWQAPSHIPQDHKNGLHKFLQLGGSIIVEIPGDIEGGSIFPSQEGIIKDILLIIREEKGTEYSISMSFHDIRETDLLIRVCQGRSGPYVGTPWNAVSFAPELTPKEGADVLWVLSPGQAIVVCPPSGWTGSEFKEQQVVLNWDGKIISQRREVSGQD